MFIVLAPHLDPSLAAINACVGTVPASSLHSLYGEAMQEAIVAPQIIVFQWEASVHITIYFIGFFLLICIDCLLILLCSLLTQSLIDQFGLSVCVRVVVVCVVVCVFIRSTSTCVRV